MKITTPFVRVWQFLGFGLILGGGLLFALQLPFLGQAAQVAPLPNQAKATDTSQSKEPPPIAEQLQRKTTRAASVADLVSQAQREGSVRVIVGLRTRFRPEGTLENQALVQTQRLNIAQAQVSLLSQMTAFSVNSLKQFASIPYLAMEIDAAGLQFLQLSPEVSTIQEDRLHSLSVAESVPLIGAPAAWTAGFTGAGQTIAILDSGVDKTHPFLTNKVVSEACYSTTGSGLTSTCPGGVAQSVETGSGIQCDFGGCEHGTHVAGIAAGTSDNFSGVAKDAKIIAIKVASRVNGCTSGNCVGILSSDIIRGLERVHSLRNDYSIAAVNLSLGGGKFTSNCDAAEIATKTVIENLRSVGIATIVASGNEGNTGSLSSPACITSAISVGSTGDGSASSSGTALQDVVSDFSNSASFLHLLAPGAWISSSVPGTGFSNFQGTSMAAPHVAGAWASLKSKLPNASVEQILMALKDTGAPITDTRNSLVKPRIKVDAAVNALATTTCNYTIAPTTQAFPVNGDLGSLTVTSASGCAWTATSNVPWVTITAGNSGAGNGSVNFTVAANTGPDRAGTLFVAGQTFTVTQASVPALAIDDGSFENAIGLGAGGTIWAVNRLTPAAYPAAINSVAIFFEGGIGVPVGTPVTILYGANPSGNTNINGIPLQSVTGTVQALDQFNLFSIPPFAISSGDFVVGFRLTHTSGQVPIAIDESSTTTRRSYVSSDGGTFTIVNDINPSFAGNFGIRALLAPKAVLSTGAALTSESCSTGNQAIDPGETVTIEVGLQNAGLEALGNLVATLQATGGVSSPSSPQTYGAMPVGGPTVTRPFTFTASGDCGGSITVTLQLQDGTTNLGTRTFTFNLGTTTTSNYSYAGTAVTIADVNTVEVPITVSDAGVVRDVNVRLRLNHTFTADLDIYLIGPDGTVVELSTDNGGSGDNYGSGANDCTGTFTVLDDAAEVSVTASGAPFLGRFRPEGMLSAFNGKLVNGIWKLRLTDDDAGIAGVLGCWQLEISRQTVPCCGASCPFITNASTIAGPIGSSITLTGVNFTGATSVKFANNVAAEFTVNSDSQITTTIPAGAVSGPLTISKNGCSDVPLDFSVITCPTVTGLGITSGLVGDRAIIQGTNLTGTTEVKFSNGIPALFTVNSSTEIAAIVPPGAVTGPITISRRGCPDLTTASFTVCPAITLTPTSLPAATVGTAYNQALTASGGATPYSFTISSGVLPSGVTLSNDGVLSGTPTQGGTFNITIRATAANGCIGTRAYSLVIACPTITLTPTTLPDGLLNAAYNQSLTASGGTAPYVFTLSAGTLPPGVTLSANGTLTGIPTRGGIYNISIRAIDTNLCTGTRDYTLLVNCDAITLAPATLPDGVGGTTYNQTLTATGGTAPYSFAVTTGTLPDGLTLSTEGVLSGTLNAAGTFTFTVVASGANGCPGLRSYTINVSTPPLSAQTRALYVLNDHISGNQIYGYAVNETTGALIRLAGFPLSTGGIGAGFAPSEMLTIDRANLRLYAINRGSNTISAYSINATTGALTPLPFSPISLGTGTWASVVVHPSGSPLVIGNSSGQIASFQITATTATAAAGSPYTTGTARAFSAAFSQDGNYVYTGGNSGTAFAGFSVNAATGVLTGLTGSPFGAGSTFPAAYATDTAGRLFMGTDDEVRVFTTTNGVPSAVTGNPFTSGLTTTDHGILHPGGFYLVADRFDDRVGVYRINGSGSSTTLAAVTGSPFTSGGLLTTALALNQSGAFLFAANGDSRNLTTFGVNATTGALTSVNIQPTNALGTVGRLCGIAYLPAPLECPPITLSPTTQSFTSGSGTGSVNITAASGCPWTATSDADWITITSSRSGAGNHTLQYAVARNLTGPRSGSITVSGQKLTITQAGDLASVNASSYLGATLGQESIVSAFGQELATGTQGVLTGSLPIMLLGTTVRVKDSAGVERPAPLFFVSPTQVNYQLPSGTALGAAIVTVTSGNLKQSTGNIIVSAVAPGIFTATSDGKGFAVGIAVHVKPDGLQVREQLVEWNGTTITARPIDLGPADEVVVLELYGTGIRYRTSQAAATANIGGANATVHYALGAPGFIGLDQLNIEVPRSLIGRGAVDVVLLVDGTPANVVKVVIK